ncbi:MAG TPA: hypothetical protein VNA25_07605 [Phycisphaerae bacterium]|nr:hypothetical protein [Phycisphaerae bacterium]
MKKATLIAAALAVLAGFVGLAWSADAAGPPAVEQPTKIPGNWKIADQPLPPLKESTARFPYRPVYGLYTWMGEYRTHRDSIKKVGWKSFRVGGPFTDDDMKMIVADNVEVLKTLGLRDMAGAAGNKKNRADYDNDEAFIADYVKGIRAFLTRYGPEGTFFKDNPTLPKRPIKYIELWNEPNFQYMIPDSNDRKSDEAKREALYAKVMPAAHKAIKADWPAVQVVGFAAGGSSCGDLRFIKNVLAKDPQVAKSFDVLSTHPYVHGVPPEADCVRSWGSYSVAKSLDTIRKTLGAHKIAETPIWYTEVGWPVSKADGGHFDMKGGGLTTPTLQAAYVCRMYALAIRLGVRRVHIMFATDTDNFNAGFFLRDKSWRPSAHAVQNMIKLLPLPDMAQAISDGTDGYYAYRMFPHALASMHRNAVIMAWNVEGPKTVAIPVRSDKVKIVDMLGHEKDAAVADGKVTVEIGPCPIYLIDPIK